LQFAKANIKKDWSNVVFSDEHRFKQFKGGNPRHNFVWAKAVSEVPGKEMERWGLTVDAWGGFSWQGKTELAFYEGTLDAPAYQDILKNSLLPKAKEWFGDEKEGWELQQDKATCHTAKSTTDWLEQHERWWKVGPPKVMTLTRSKTFGPSLTRDLRTKSLRQRKE